MRKNLRKRMIDKDLSKKQIADFLGISYKSLLNKIKGDSDFLLSEAMAIHDSFFPDDDYNQLFFEDGETE